MVLKAMVIRPRSFASFTIGSLSGLHDQEPSGLDRRQMFICAAAAARLQLECHDLQKNEPA